jgi:ATP-dependent DNA helicase RecQ
MHAPQLAPPSREEILTLLRTRFSHRRFRPGQEDVLQAVLTGRDVVAVLPTGAGKSLVFQIASQVLPGVTIVVSPLLALMHDQEESLEDLGVEVAVVNSARTQAQNDEELARVERGEARLLYVTPERLLNEAFVREIAALPVSLLAVDEAHCISEWGHSFRPAYQSLALARRRLGRPTVLALTATATPWVRRDIAEQLGMDDPEIIVRGSDRPNIFFEVQRVETEADEFRALRRLLDPDQEGTETGAQARDEHAAEIFIGPGIIYTATTRAARETAEWLQEWGISADFYHGQRSKRDRERVQDAFMAGEIRVVAATNAFGLGIDKPDVRFVIHRDIPASLEAYYQEAGRAGRDGASARAILLYRPADLGRAAFLAGGGRLAREDVVAVCAALLEHGEVAPRKLASLTGLSQPTLLRVVAALEAEDVVGRRRGRLRLLRSECDPDDVSLEAEEHRRAYEASRLSMMRGYAETADCRREYIMNYFGEAYDPAGCQGCDNSLKLRIVSRPAPAGPFSVGAPVRHASWGDGIVERATADTVTVLFDAVGFKTFDLALVQERNLIVPSAQVGA